MNNVELCDFLLKIKDKREKFPLLIDGPWGSGKTYSIKKFLEFDKDSNNIGYISLFGVESENEIISMLSKHIHPSFISSFNNQLNLSTTENNEDEIDSFIVFDDLERIDYKKVSYVSIFGIIERLRQFGYIVICIVDSENISDKEIYDKYLEKGFSCKKKIDSL